MAEPVLRVEPHAGIFPSMILAPTFQVVDVRRRLDWRIHCFRMVVVHEVRGLLRPEDPCLTVHQQRGLLSGYVSGCIARVRRIGIPFRLVVTVIRGVILAVAVPFLIFLGPANLPPVRQLLHAVALREPT